VVALTRPDLMIARVHTSSAALNSIVQVHSSCLMCCKGSVRACLHLHCQSMPYTFKLLLLSTALLLPLIATAIMQV
jgi:hypothetical protein